MRELGRCWDGRRIVRRLFSKQQATSGNQAASAKQESSHKLATIRWYSGDNERKKMEVKFEESGTPLSELHLRTGTNETSEEQLSRMIQATRTLRTASPARVWSPTRRQE